MKKCAKTYTTVDKVPALHCCQYNLTVNAIINWNCICMVKYIYTSVFAVLNDELLAVYCTRHFQNFTIFNIFYNVLFQIYCISFIPKTYNKKKALLQHTYSLWKFVSKCVYFWNNLQHVNTKNFLIFFFVNVDKKS